MSGRFITIIIISNYLIEPLIVLLRAIDRLIRKSGFSNGVNDQLKITLLSLLKKDNLSFSIRRKILKILPWIKPLETSIDSILTAMEDAPPEVVVLCLPPLGDAGSLFINCGIIIISSVARLSRKQEVKAKVQTLLLKFISDDSEIHYQPDTLIADEEG